MEATSKGCHQVIAYWVEVHKGQEPKGWHLPGNKDMFPKHPCELQVSNGPKELGSVMKKHKAHG